MTAMIALAVLILLVAIRNPGVWGYLLAHPSSLDVRALTLWMSFGCLPLFMAVALWTIMLGVGRRTLVAIGTRPHGGLDAIAAAALGLGLTGQAVFLMGWAGALQPLSLTILLAAATALGITVWKRLSTFHRPRLHAAHSFIAGLLAYAVFHLLVVSLAPPISWDVRAYHLALPELYLRNERLVEVPWLLHSHWPHLMEALYALPLAAGHDSAAALVHAGACVLLATGVFVAGGGWPAALILAGQPALQRVAPSAHSDGACALFFFAAAIALARWKETKRSGWLLVGGLLGGLAASAKLFGATGVAAWTVWLAWRERRPREAALFAACSAAVVGPWLLRTWLATGDPLWPLLRLSAASAELAARNAQTNFWAWPPPAWLLSHDGPAFLLAPLAGLALLTQKGAKRASTLELLLWIPAPLLLLLAFRQHEAWRYMMPVYAAASLTCGRWATAAFEAGPIRRYAAIVLIMVGAAPIIGLTQNNELFAVLGLRSSLTPEASPRALYEDRTVDVASFYREARAVLPANARVLLFREVRGYNAGFEYVWGDPINQSEINYRRLRDYDALRARLQTLGITHVLDHEGSHLYQKDPLYYDERTLTLMSGMLKHRARTLLTREGIVLHQLL